MRLPLLNARMLLADLLFAGVLQSQAGDVPPVIIDYFYEAGCPDCLKVRQQVLPELQERFEGFYCLNYHDLNERTNVMLLVAYQKKLHITENKPVSIVVDHTHVFSGFEEIRTGLVERVDLCVSERLESGWTALAPTMPSLPPIAASTNSTR